VGNKAVTEKSRDAALVRSRLVGDEEIRLGADFFREPTALTEMMRSTPRASSRSVCAGNDFARKDAVAARMAGEKTTCSLHGSQTKASGRNLRTEF